MDGSHLYLDELVDIALEQSFPASDPPAFVAAAAVVGAPAKPRFARCAGGSSGCGKAPAGEARSPAAARRRRLHPMPCRGITAQQRYSDSRAGGVA